jgi:hypothetical protein
VVTEYKASNQPGGQAQYYCLTSGQTFNPALTQPCQIVPPPPGFALLFGNPINNQTWTQPPGTVATFIGLFDFSQADVIGLGSGGGGGGTLNISVNSTPLGSTAPIANFNTQSGVVEGLENGAIAKHQGGFRLCREMGDHLLDIGIRYLLDKFLMEFRGADSSMGNG